MATRGTGKTLQQILDEVSADNNASAQRQIEAQRKITEQSIQKNDAVVDKATAATTAQYQKQIDEAPTVYREQYDNNALAEAVNRRKLQESMANLGLTDSGLNRTQQTALSVMKGNADAATRQQQQEYVDGLQSAIDQVYAKGEAEKAAFANTKNTTQSKWESDLWLEVEKANREQANQRYAIQEQTLDEKYAADLAAEREAEKNRIDYNKWLIENDLVEDKDGNLRKRVDTTGPTWTDEAFAQAQDIYKTKGKTALENYVYALGNQYGWTGERADLFVSSVEKNTTPLWSDDSALWQDRMYKKTGTDTTNWGWGIDNNDEVSYIDSAGKEVKITLKSLYDKLVAEGVSEKDAKKYVNQFNSYTDKNKDFMHLK